MITGVDGRQWTVREMPPAPYDRRGASTLVFFTDDAMRRVRHYPPDWFDRTDDDLYSLSLTR